jgi:hypothetical protein
MSRNANLTICLAQQGFAMAARGDIGTLIREVSEVHENYMRETCRLVAGSAEKRLP